MIKKYGQFIDKKTNEEFVLGSEAPTKPGVSPTPDVKPGTAQPLPSEPISPSPIRRERTSPVPAPSKAEAQMEEEGSDLYTTKMQELADILGVDFSGGQIVYNGKKIIFPSETEKYQIEGVKKGFNTAEEVVSELEKISPQTVSGRRTQETEEELHSLKDDELGDEIEREFESKSYKSRYNRR